MVNDISEALIEFNPKLPKLSKNESQVLKLLVEAGKLIAPIYLEQEKQAKVEIDKKELEKAAKKDPAILSPYTVIEQLGGKLVAIPYHIKYAKLLKPIAEKLEGAAQISENKEFGKALKIQAEALMDGNYEQAIATWLKVKPYILDITIGPLNHFDNQLFFGKAAYQAWVGVLDTEGTERLNNYKSIVLNASGKVLAPKERINNLDHVKAKTIDVVLLSGLLAKTKVVGINLPMDDINMVEKYGSDITIFNQPNDLRLKEQILPVFNKIFSLPFREGFTEDDLKRGYLRTVALHQLAHSFLYYRNSSRNLRDLYPIIYELAATVLGLRMAGALLLKDRITNKQLESMMVTFTCRSFYLMHRQKSDKQMGNYALGSTVFINFMLENGAMKDTGSYMVLNFTKMFVSSHELSSILESLLSQGTREDAEQLIKEYGQLGPI